MKKILLFFVAMSIILSASVIVKGDTQPVPPLFGSKSLPKYNQEMLAVGIGDVNGSWEGNEVVWDCDGDPSYVFETHGSGNDWVACEIWNKGRDIGYERGLGIGDVDPRYPGNEIVHGLWNLTVLTYNATIGQWESTMVFDYPYSDSGYKHSCNHLSIGDFDKMHEGNEILSVTHMGHIYETYFDNTTNNWTTNLIDANGVCWEWCDIGDVNLEHAGNEIVVGGITDPYGDYSLVRVYYEMGGEYINTTVYDTTNTSIVRSCIFCIIDINSTNNVSEIVASGPLTVASWNGSGYDVVDMTPIKYSESDVWVSGLPAVGDIWMGHPGDEIIIARWIYNDSTNIYCEIANLVWQDAGNLYYKTVYKNENNNMLFCIAIGEFDRGHSGIEVAVGGGGGCYELLPYEQTDETWHGVFIFSAGVVAVVSVWKFRGKFSRHTED